MAVTRRGGEEGEPVAGAPRRGAASHEEGGGGQETSSPRSNFAAGERVAGAPWRGAAGHEGVTGLETTPKFFLARGAGLCSGHQNSMAVWVGGGHPTVAATFGPLLPLFLGWDC
ncbi:UNVERIFIED_CONTAM: hypothetical protein FKN15_002684 [Acipenser sinensis]